MIIQERDNSPLSEKPIVLSNHAYQRTGTFEVPPLLGDQLTVVLSGTNTMARQLDGRRERGVIRPGDVTIVPRGTASTWTPHISSPNRTLHMLIQPSMWNWAAQAGEFDVAAIQLRGDFAAADPLIHQIGLALWEESRFGAVGAALYTQTLCQTLVMHLLRHYTTLQPRSADLPAFQSQFSKAREYIETFLAEDITLDTLAALEGLSPYHFARLFREAIGQPPHQYLISRRVERAKGLLSSSRLSLAQIAIEVGFANQSHLTRHFKRLVGVTPGRFRA